MTAGIWILLAVDAVVAATSIWYRAVEMPRISYGHYMWFQVAASCAVAAAVISGLVLMAFFRTKRNMRAWNLCYAGVSFGNLLSLIVPIIALLIRGFWYRMCKNPRECPERLDHEALQVAIFCVATIAWALTGHTALIYKVHAFVPEEGAAMPASATPSQTALILKKGPRVPLKTPLAPLESFPHKAAAEPSTSATPSSDLIV